jgi:hypothetical protein
MTPIIPSIRLFTNQQDSEIKLSAVILEYQDTCYHLQTQTGDTIHVFSQSICIYVLITNKELDRINLYAYMKPEADPITSICLDSVKEIQAVLGTKWERLSIRAIVVRLLELLQ